MKNKLPPHLVTHLTVTPHHHKCVGLLLGLTLVYKTCIKSVFRNVEMGKTGWVPRIFRICKSHREYRKQRKQLVTSLVVQWLRLCVANAGGVEPIPGRGTKIPQAKI